MGNTFISAMETELCKLETIKKLNTANYFLVAFKYNPYRLHSLNKTDVLKNSRFDKFTSDFVAFGQCEMLESEFFLEFH